MTKFNTIHVLGIMMLSVIAIAPVVDAGCSCSGGTWDPSGFLNSELGTGQPVQPGSAGDSAAGNSGSGTQKPLDRVASFPNGAIIKAMKSVSSSDVVMDVSNGNSYASSHIKDAIHIPSKNFLNGEGDLKTDEELAKVLGDAGVSRDDSIVLYGSKESSGEAEFAFLVLRYLGQKDVLLLDGSLADWKAAGLPEETSENILPGTEYGPMVKPEVIAEYQYVKSGQAQIIDVRPFVEFGKGRIPGSIALDPSNVIKGDKIKNSDDLSAIFSRLDKEKPIVVYSDDYSRSALVWYALQLMGYEASIYTWEDWKEHKSGEVATETTSETGNKTSPAGEDAIGSKYTKLGTT
jgi:thiosulfate/3-mercaptopyruvate sulfurtransferase